MRRLIWLALLLSSGCTNAVNFKPTMASDPPQLGLEGIALANELSKAYETSTNRAICGKLDLGYQEARKSTVARYNKNGRTARDVFSCVMFKKAVESEVESHVRAGLALSDYFCDNFFERVAEHSGKRRFARNATNDVGTLVSTVLGLASAGSAVTGGIGAGFGLLDSSWRNYDDNFLVSADLPTLQKLIYSEQDKFRTSLVLPKNYPDATNVIIRYANLCSFVGMRSLLTKSMTDKTETNTAETSATKDLVRSRAEEFVKAYDEMQAKKKAAKGAETGDGDGSEAPKAETAPAPPTG